LKNGDPQIGEIQLVRCIAEVEHAFLSQRNSGGCEFAVEKETKATKNSITV